jgi:hypothetical protein
VKEENDIIKRRTERKQVSGCWKQAWPDTEACQVIPTHRDMPKRLAVPDPKA